MFSIELWSIDGQVRYLPHDAPFCGDSEFHVEFIGDCVQLRVIVTRNNREERVAQCKKNLIREMGHRVADMGLLEHKIANMDDADDLKDVRTIANNHASIIDEFRNKESYNVIYQTTSTTFTATLNPGVWTKLGWYNKPVMFCVVEGEKSEVVERTVETIPWLTSRFEIAKFACSLFTAEIGLSFKKKNDEKDKVVITRVDEGKSAYSAGIIKDDVLVSIDGNNISTKEDFFKFCTNTIGNTTEWIVERKKKIVNISMMVGARNVLLKDLKHLVGDLKSVRPPVVHFLSSS